VSVDYEIVRYEPEHRELVVELQRELWSSDVALNRRFLEWKYERNPCSRDAPIFLALHGGKAVGMRGFVGARWEAGTPSQVFPVLLAGDTLVSEPHRNRGLVTRIMRRALADLDATGAGHLLSIAPSRVNVFGLLTLGWKSIGMLRPVGRSTGLAAGRRRLRGAVARLPFLWRYRDARWLYARDERRPFRHLDAARHDKSPIAIEDQPRPAAMSDLVQRLGHDGRIRQVRDETYFRWRFENPLAEFRFLYWEEAERLEGYLVLHRKVSNLGDWDRVKIADLQASRMAVRAALLRSAIEQGRFSELVTWAASLAGSEVALLHSHGFAPVDAHETTRGCPCILVRPVQDNAPGAEWLLGGRRLLHLNDWDVRLLDSMR